MPDRLYMAVHDPPRMSDRIAAHWVEVCIAVMTVLRGIITVADPHIPAISPAIMGLPPGLTGLLGLLMTAGGIAWLASILHRYQTVNRWWLMQRWGLSLAGLGWTCYAIASLALRASAVVTWSSALTYAAACWGLYIISFRVERAIRSRRGLP